MKKRYPFSFPVLYQSVFKYASSYDQVLSVHALFFGEIIDKDNYINRIAAGTITEYVKAKRVIRADLVDAVCNFSDEELKHRIEILKFQDISAVIEAIKRLLRMVHISNALREELLEEADATTDKVLFVGKIFQQSIKCPFLKMNFKSADKEYFDAIWYGYEIEEDTIEVNNKPTDAVDDQKKMSRQQEASSKVNEKQEEAKQEDEPQGTSTEESATTKELIFEDKLDELVYLIKQANADKENVFNFKGGNYGIECFEVNLPEDYHSLIKFISPIYGEELGLINLDIADLMTSLSLDVESRTIKEGNLFLTKIKGSYNQCMDLVNWVVWKEKAISVTIHITGNDSLGLDNIYELSHAVIDRCDGDALALFGVSIETDMKDEEIEMRIALRYDPNWKEAKQEEAPTPETNTPKNDFDFNLSDYFGDIFGDLEFGKSPQMNQEEKSIKKETTESVEKQKPHKEIKVMNLFK